MTLSLKVTPAGAVTATLTFDTGKTKKGKKVYWKPTCTTVVIPVSAADAAERLAKEGADLRVLLLSAKERICPHDLLGRPVYLCRIAKTYIRSVARLFHHASK